MYFFSSWRLLDADGNILPIKGATYHVAVFAQQHESVKLGIAMGTWEENFVEPMPLVKPSCKRDMTDFSEKYTTLADKFPNLSCQASGRASIGKPSKPAKCLAGKVCRRNDQACKDKYIPPHMGCGGQHCPAAVQVWDAVNTRMMETMAIEFTGQADVDFVRGMIPHHLAALDMCDALVEQLSCKSYEDIGALEGMVGEHPFAVEISLHRDDLGL